MIQLIIESPVIFSELVEDLLKQMDGKEGDFILSEDDKKRVISKEMDVIINPFSLECNDRKIQQKLYQEIATLAKEQIFSETNELYARIMSYMEKLVELVPYGLDYDEEENLIGLIKVINLRIQAGTDSLVERVIEYLRAMHQLARVNIFLFINIKSYLNEDDLQSLYEFSRYEKVNIILIENYKRIYINTEKTCIIDKDCCIIYL